MNKMTGECTIEQFWVEVADIGWGTKTTDYDAIKKSMLEQWDDEFIESFRHILEGFQSELYEKVGVYERRNHVSCECGDDGFGDLLSHMVGLGKEHFEACMADPMVVVKRGQKSDYTEKFAYCVPYMADAPKETLEEAVAKIRAEYAERDRPITEDELLMAAYTRTLGDRAEQEPRYYGAWARAQGHDLEKLMDSEFGEIFGKDLVHVVSAFTDVGKDEPQLMVERGKAVVKALDRIEKKRVQLLKEQEERLKVLREWSYWGCRNMVTDILKEDA